MIYNRAEGLLFNLLNYTSRRRKRFHQIQTLPNHDEYTEALNLRLVALRFVSLLKVYPLPEKDFLKAIHKYELTNPCKCTEIHYSTK